MTTRKAVIVSGYFDPLHVGHINCFKEARKLGKVLFVIVNTDKQAINKKGYVFMPLEERIKILCALRAVSYAVPSIDEDATVCKTLEDLVRNLRNKLTLNPEFIFVNGGDRVKENVPEGKVCKELGIEMAFGVGGDKIQSSSELVKRMSNTQ